MTTIKVTVPQAGKDDATKSGNANKEVRFFKGEDVRKQELEQEERKAFEQWWNSEECTNAMRKGEAKSFGLAVWLARSRR